MQDSTKLWGSEAGNPGGVVREFAFTRPAVQGTGEAPRNRESAAAIGCRGRAFPAAPFSAGVLVLLLAGLAAQSQAQSFTLNNGNSAVTINTAASAGMASYLVDGVNQVQDQWFYYRIGSVGPEAPIDSISLPNASQSDARTLDLSYANVQYSARVVYTLTGGAAGSGQSGLNETITFLNESATQPLSLSFFDYSDYDLNGVAGGQTLQFGTTSIPTTWINHFTQTMGPSSLTTKLTSGVFAPSHVEAALYNQTLASLNDGSPTTLNDNLGPVTGDVTGTFEWDVTLAPDTSLTISSLISVQVPEPSVLGVFAVGLVAVVCRTRRTRRVGV